MKKFQVMLSRAYAVDIYANNIDQAKMMVEFFIGDPKDCSKEPDRKKHQFMIDDIEMRINEAFEASEYEEN